MLNVFVETLQRLFLNALGVFFENPKRLFLKSLSVSTPLTSIDLALQIQPTLKCAAPA